MLTMRKIGAEGFCPKERDWNRPEALQEWRECWAETSNRVLERAGREERIDHRSLESQGIRHQLPQVHVGPHAKALDRRGIESERAEFNREIQGHNAVVIDLTKARAEREILRGERG